MLMQLIHILFFYIDCETERRLVSLLYIKMEKIRNIEEYVRVSIGQNYVNFIF